MRESLAEEFEMYRLLQRLVDVETDPKGPESIGLGVPVWSDGTWIAIDRVDLVGRPNDIVITRMASISEFDADAVRVRMYERARDQKPPRSLAESTFREVLVSCLESRESVTLVLESPDCFLRGYIVGVEEDGLNLQVVTSVLNRYGVEYVDFDNLLRIHIRGPEEEFFGFLRRREAEVFGVGDSES